MTREAQLDSDLILYQTKDGRTRIQFRFETVSKHYLREDKIEELDRLGVMFLDFAEDQAKRRKQIFLKDWLIRLDDFLKFNERAILPNPGQMSRAAAYQRSEEDYERFAAPNWNRREKLIFLNF